MSIVKISVPVTGAERDVSALSSAFQMARAFNAHVEVLFIQRDPHDVVTYSTMTLRPDIIGNMINAEIELQEIASKAAQHNFSNVAAECGVRIMDAPSRIGAATANYRAVTGHLGQVMADAAILSDLVVFPPIVKGDDLHDAFLQVLVRVGRPVLLSARAKPAHIGQRVVIGWDGRSAAARALVAALPILEKAETAQLVTIGPLSSNECSTEDARKFLALHEIRCGELIIEEGARPVSDMLVDAATGSGYDLLVVGGYGHSRLMESIFGGVTEGIVSHAELPILMVH
jgi:nucleotide-binding universal stress UspA family protein